MPKSFDSVLLELKNYPHQLPVETRYSDMDVAQHVNNVAIMKYYETARTRYLMTIFGGKKQFFSAENIFVNVEATVTYLAEVHFPERVIVGTAITTMGNSSCRVQQAVFQAGACVGLCLTTMVMTCNGLSNLIPKALREQLQTELQLFKEPSACKEPSVNKEPSAN